MLKKILFSICLNALFTSAFSQKLLAVTYSRTEVFIIDSALSYNGKATLVQEPFHPCATVSDTSASFLFYGMNEKIKHWQFKKVMGNKVQHHTTYTDFDNNTVWSGVNYAAMKNKMVAEKFPTAVWEILDQSKTILGYNCQMATQISAAGDSTIIWFTMALDPYKAKLLFPTAPGAVLAAEVPSARGRIVFEATDVYEYEGKLVFPEKARKITKEEYWQKRNKYEAGRW